jgi:hypothetical protein
MNRIINSGYFIATLLSLFVLQGCKDDDPTQAEKNSQIFRAHEWVVKEVLVDNVDKTSIYEGLSIIWKKGSTFTSMNGGGIWPASGTWSFKDNSGDILLVSLGVDGDKEVEVMVRSLDQSAMILEFQWDESTLGSGRGSSVTGAHQFKFVPR